MYDPINCKDCEICDVIFDEKSFLINGDGVGDNFQLSLEFISGNKEPCIQDKSDVVVPEVDISQDVPQLEDDDNSSVDDGFTDAVENLKDELDEDDIILLRKSTRVTDKPDRLCFMAGLADEPRKVMMLTNG